MEHLSLLYISFLSFFLALTMCSAWFSLRPGDRRMRKNSCRFLHEWEAAASVTSSRRGKTEVSGDRLVHRHVRKTAAIKQVHRYLLRNTKKDLHQIKNYVYHLVCAFPQQNS